MPHDDTAQERKKVEHAWADYLNLEYNTVVDIESVISAVCDVQPPAAPHSPECQTEPRPDTHPRPQS